MLILVTYDVNTETPEGCKRLGKVARKCLSYGTRVQNSVFECVIDSAQYVKLKNELSQIISQDKDSLRFYNLGNNYKNSVVHIGAKPTTSADEVLII